MKTIVLSLITLQLGLAAVATALEVATIQTVQGKTYQHCTILKRDPDGVAFSHRKGTARVLYSDLPEAARGELGYDAKKEADFEKAREQTKQAKLKERLLQQERTAELLHAARLAEIKRITQMQQSYFILQQSPWFNGPVPAVGFANNGFFLPPTVQNLNRGWDSVGIAPIVAGTGGIYIPQSGGFNFNGLPQVHYSPTLGYYNPGQYHNPAVRQLGSFGVVPGLASPAPPAVVPGVSIPGSASFSR